MSQLQTQETHKNGVPDREALRSNLEATRTAFHELLESIPPEAWQRKGASTAWKVREIAFHLAHDMEFVPKLVEQAKAGKNFLNMPAFIGGKVNYLLTRFLARKETPESLAKKYDAYFEEALATLDKIQDDEWQRGAEFFGEGYWTVETIFKNIPRHFQEHAEQIKGSIEAGGK